ncbi:hypothetical protein L2E82_20254 [Cichorium intybus]|uniref:Uncharacterized protein n=1 Tax=Cichorium intybus TaxID=13427 RepID=A0ACB9DSI6_CICIN|nr:hypothetical protein L2E82_20254 [Cichorium intybus]
MGLCQWMIPMVMVVLFDGFFLLSDAGRTAGFDKNVPFDEFYNVTWGNHHVQFLNQGREVKLSLDQSSGAGFASKSYYGSGYFQMKIKLPAKDSAGVVTAYYLFLNTTIHDKIMHDELDFEFLGNRPGKPITLSTNVFAHGIGGREQKFTLWFDPTADFHNYKLLWNHHHIVFFVDETPIRVFKNNINKGVGYPNNTMQLIVSLWDGSSWATDGGQTKANWANGPVETQFQGFKIDGCLSPLKSLNKDCFAPSYWWNTKNYWQLDTTQQKAYDEVRKKYMNYDYCTDKGRYPKPPPECIGGK